MDSQDHGSEGPLRLCYYSTLMGTVLEWPVQDNNENTEQKKWHLNTVLIN